MYCKHYNGTSRATRSRHWWKCLLILPPYYCPAILSMYDIHNKSSFWGNSKVIDFPPYILAFEATGAKILWSKDLNFLVPKDVYICQHQPPKCRSWSVEIFLFQSTLKPHMEQPSIMRNFFVQLLDHDFSNPYNKTIKMSTHISIRTVKFGVLGLSCKKWSQFYLKI